MKNSLATFCFISPAVLLMLLFLILPIIWVIILVLVTISLETAIFIL